MKKRILTLVLTAVLFVTAVFMLSSCTMLIEKVRGGDGANLEYKLSENEKYYIVSGYNEDIDNDIKIPAKHKGKPVKAIGEGAFRACSSLTSVTIPDSVTIISERAFYYCTSLTSITIPDSVTSIGESAFYLCVKLTIYCEAVSQPSSWNSGWNYSGCPVVWGYKGN